MSSNRVLFALILLAIVPAPLALAQDDDGGGGGGGGGGGMRSGGMGNTGPEFITDTGPQLKERFAAVYPYDLALAGTTGEVELKFNVDVNGEPQNITVLNASDDAFVPAAVAAAESWRYKPAQKRNRPVPAENEKRTIKFNPRSRDVDFDDSARKVVAELKKPEPQIVGASELDGGVPKVLNKFVQNYPDGALVAGLGEGSAMIECIIDQQGKPRLPKIISATHESFGWAAATAVLRLQFSPPMKNGKPVLTRLRMPIQYKVNVRPPPGAGQAPQGGPRGEGRRPPPGDSGG